MVNSSGIDFDRTIGAKLQLLCIDNPQVRKRIKDNEQIDIATVPCILSIFPNGGVEKYDGGHAFAWVENLISRYAPPPLPKPMPPPPSREEYEKMDPEQEQNEPEEEMRSQARSQPQKKQQRVKPVKVPSRMKPIQQATSIDDIPLEDDGSDRHRNIPQPKRIRQDEDKFVEDENLFAGDMPDNRHEPNNVVRVSAADRRTSPDPNGVRAKAEELARGRDDIDREFSSPKQRPLGDRRP